MAKFLTAADILAIPDKIAQQEIASAGGVVNVKRLSPADNEKLALFYTSKTDGENIRYNRAEFQGLIMSLVIVGEDGKTPVFTSEAINALREKDAELWAELWAAIDAANPIGTAADIEEAKKNS